MFYYALVHPHLTYDILIWGSPINHILIVYNFRKTKSCVPLPIKDRLLELHQFIEDNKFLK